MKRYLVCVGEDPTMYQTDDLALVREWLEDDFTLAVDLEVGTLVHADIKEEKKIEELPPYPIADDDNDGDGSEDY